MTFPPTPSPWDAACAGQWQRQDKRALRSFLAWQGQDIRIESSLHRQLQHLQSKDLTAASSLNSQYTHGNTELRTWDPEETHSARDGLTFLAPVHSYTASPPARTADTHSTSGITASEPKPTRTGWGRGDGDTADRHGTSCILSKGQRRRAPEEPLLGWRLGAARVLRSVGSLDAPGWRGAHPFAEHKPSLRWKVFLPPVPEAEQGGEHDRPKCYSPRTVPAYSLGLKERETREQQ